MKNLLAGIFLSMATIAPAALAGDGWAFSQRVFQTLAESERIHETATHLAIERIERIKGIRPDNAVYRIQVGRPDMNQVSQCFEVKLRAGEVDELSELSPCIPRLNQ